MIEKILTQKPFYLLAFSMLFLPILVCSYLLVLKQQNLKEKASQIEQILIKAKKTSPLRKNLSLFLEKHTNVDKSYLENHIETLSFLQKEKESLKPLLSHPAFKDSDMSARLKFIDAGENNLSFIEDQPRKNAICKETLLHQKRSIELDKDDLVLLLNLLENSEEKRPQILFKSFTLTKNASHTFNLKVDLLKREF